MGLGALLGNKTNYTADEINLLVHLAHCALPPWKSWNVSVNGEYMDMGGNFGFAADLWDFPLLPEQQLFVSACMISLVNFFGKKIQVSGRNMPDAAATDVELSDWPVYEGSFFGNIFSENITKYVCQGTPEQEALQQSPDRQWRRCTDFPQYNCEFVFMGKCSEVCSMHFSHYQYSVCTGADGVQYPAMNVFLRKNPSRRASRGQF